MTFPKKLSFLEDRWDEDVASKLDGPELLRYRSNLLGSDLRLTNFGGGNTSSKIEEIDPSDGQTKTVLWVKGSGGDLGSIKRAGFATLYFDKLLALEKKYKGVELEDEIASLYPLCTFGNNLVAASIDTPLHGFLPFPHVDHLHPDWGIALAASANGLDKLEEFNRRFGHSMVWVPWLRPGFELAMRMRTAVAAMPGCDGVVLGGHGLFTWGKTHRESYLNTITAVDQIGQLIHEHGARKGPSFRGTKYDSLTSRESLALRLLPLLRGRLSTTQRVIGSFTSVPDVMTFVNSRSAKRLAYLGTSCPDHFIRTKIRPLFLDWDPSSSREALEDAVESLEKILDGALETYRLEYAEYYAKHAVSDSPAMREPNPTVVLVPGVGMFSFGKSKAESRIIGEFYLNAIHVMQGAGSLDEGKCPGVLPQAGDAAPTEAFGVFENYVALPPREAFRIEYWALEEAKIRRQPPDKELSRRIVLVMGGAGGLGREVVLTAAARGAHITVADPSLDRARALAEEATAIGGKECAIATLIQIGDRNAIRAALEATVTGFGGIDIVIADTTASSSQDSFAPRDDIAANYRLMDELALFFKRQGVSGTVVLVESANAAQGKEHSGVSQAAFTSMVRAIPETHGSFMCIRGVHMNAITTESTIKCAKTILDLVDPEAPMVTGRVVLIEDNQVGDADHSIQSVIEG